MSGGDSDGPSMKVTNMVLLNEFLVQDSCWKRLIVIFNHRRLILIFILSIYSLIITPIFAINMSLYGNFLRNDGDCIAKLTVVNAIVISAYAFEMITMLLIFVRLRTVKETLGIKEELRRTVLAVFVSVVLQIINISTGIEQILDDTFQFHSYQIFEILLPTSFNIWCALYVPYRKAGGKVFPSRKGDGQHELQRAMSMHEPTYMQKIEDFKVLLKDKEFARLFQEFLTLELNAQNFLFYKDIEAVRDRRISAREIADLYLHPTAPLHVNLTQDTKNKIFKFMESRKNPASSNGSKVALTTSDFQNQQEYANMFDQAEEEVLRVLFMDGFSRFRTTKAYHDWKVSRKIAKNPQAFIPGELNDRNTHNWFENFELSRDKSRYQPRPAAPTGAEWPSASVRSQSGYVERSKTVGFSEYDPKEADVVPLKKHIVINPIVITVDKPNLVPDQHLEPVVFEASSATPPMKSPTGSISEVL
eukprot:TRINITY_DN14242_c0_g1_i1.p1 TRINITY_DN14242_c0_g1~~TRINITY_DN14242_c0_g1_i1.p1  ORF type:complete len:551 (+),score=83.56 TRINITY_DN14242_c0_g1_i1:229-1653(+)